MLREVAEYPNSFIALGPGEERIETERYTLCLSSARFANTVQRQRFAPDELDEVIAEIRDHLRQRGRTRTQWEVGSAMAGLVGLLLRRGLKPDTDPHAIALALRRAPPPPPDGVEARRVRTYEEYAAGHEVQWQAFGSTAQEAAEYRTTLASRWRSGTKIMHAAWLDGEMVSAGISAATPHGLALFGGATLEPARGHGAYRGLIHARWQEAQAMGLPALVTQAGAMSRPILERLGFVAIGRVDIVVDEFDG